MVASYFRCFALHAMCTHLDTMCGDGIGLVLMHSSMACSLKIIIIRRSLLLVTCWLLEHSYTRIHIYTYKYKRVYKYGAGYKWALA